jgi:hypothetical protein
MEQELQVQCNLDSVIAKTDKIVSAVIVSLKFMLVLHGTMDNLIVAHFACRNDSWHKLTS